MIEQEQLAEAQHSLFSESQKQKWRNETGAIGLVFISKSMGPPPPGAILILSFNFSSRDIFFLNEFHISSLFLTRRFLFPLLEDTSILVQNKN